MAIASALDAGSSRACQAKRMSAMGMRTLATQGHSSSGLHVKRLLRRSTAFLFMAACALQGRLAKVFLQPQQQQGQPPAAASSPVTGAAQNWAASPEDLKLEMEMSSDLSSSAAHSVLARRRALLAGTVALSGASASWLSMPEEASAFREDRILNSKERYAPILRKYYQKLEGLRDDLELLIEYDTGKRVEIYARPADWYKGLDRKLVGPLTLVPNAAIEKGCTQLSDPGSVKGVLLIPRGLCNFRKKMDVAEATGAQSVIVYDAKVTRQPEETLGLTGLIRSKSMATRSLGDALTGGAALQPYEKGITIMQENKGLNQPQPKMEAAMINLDNGTKLADYLKDGGEAKILRVQRREFYEGIDKFIKKDLPKMLDFMETLGFAMRRTKEDIGGPIVRQLKVDRLAFEAAVKSKDYAEIRRTWKVWQGSLDNLGTFELEEVI